MLSSPGALVSSRIRRSHRASQQPHKMNGIRPQVFFAPAMAQFFSHNSYYPNQSFALAINIRRQRGLSVTEALKDSIRPANSESFLPRALKSGHRLGDITILVGIYSHGIEEAKSPPIMRRSDGRKLRFLPEMMGSSSTDLAITQHYIWRLSSIALACYDRAFPSDWP
jgi:hypothetical protein